MNKFKTFIMLLFVLLNIGYGGRNLTHFEMGSPIYRDLCPGLVPLVGGQHWHAGVYEYFNISPNGNAIIRHSEMNAGAVHLTYISGEIDNYYDNYNFSGDWNSIGDEMIQFKTNFLGSFNECGVSDAAYRGSYYNHTPPYSGWDYYQVLSNISDLNNADPEYTFLDMIKPKALSYDYIFPNGGEDGQPISFMRNTTDGSPAIVVYQAIRGDGTYETNLNPFNKKVKVWLGNAENIGNTRCDGVIEFCLEKAGISVSGGEDITIGQISTLEAHNDFHTSTYNVGELCPKIQSGEQANDTELGRLTNQAPTSGGFVITPSSDGSLADISFLVNDVQSTRVYVSVYAKKAHHTEWRIIEDGQGLLKFQSIDFVSGENSAQVNIPEWNGMAEDGYHFVSLQQNMQYGVIVFDQGANYTKNTYVGGTEKELANRNIDDAGQHIVGGAVIGT